VVGMDNPARACGSAGRVIQGNKGGQAGFLPPDRVSVNGSGSSRRSTSVPRKTHVASASFGDHSASWRGAFETGRARTSAVRLVRPSLGVAHVRTIELSTDQGPFVR